MSDLQPSAASEPPLFAGTLSGLSCFFGVMLPLITLGVELTTGLNADVFFDPIPTIFHVLVVASVPAANLWAWLNVRRRNAAHLRALTFANGWAIGVASFYSILFLPLLPLGVLAVIYFGMGLLPLTPLLSLVAALGLRRRLRKLGADPASPNAAGPPKLWPGVAMGILALLALDAPSTFTRLGMQMATSQNGETRERGVRWLRTAGSEDVLLRHCYVRAGTATDMLSFLFNVTRPVSTDQARTLYYRVTGVPFNARQAPLSNHRRHGGFMRPARTTEFDFEQGSPAVGGRLPDLSLASSRLDGSLDGNAALGYLEWTLVFRNDANIPREARAQIALPPGAVVSRLTLWINGEEREAAFAGRGQVTQAYQRVVSRSRDPVLVTSAGHDRIALQLFPVPGGGEMKVRIGMTAPLALRGAGEGVLHLPYFHERNFDIDPKLGHWVWIESKTPLRSELATPSTEDGIFAFRAQIEDGRLGSAASDMVVERNPAVASWALDSKAAGFWVRQSIVDRDAQPPTRLVIVVDGSASMRQAVPQLAQALADVPASVGLQLLFAHDSIIEPEFVSSADTLTQALRQFDYGGGQDNTDALARGIDHALAQPGSAVLWIHGPQPVLLATGEPLLQRLERRARLPVVYDLQTQPGANLLGQKFEGRLRPVSLRTEDLRPLILGWRPGARHWVIERERLAASSANTLPPEAQTSDHLVRLWANDEIERLLASPVRPQREQAIELAQRYQLVTPVTGAVVLETQEQFSASGLEPVPPGSVPTIPEPETWALIVIALLVLAAAHERRKLHAGTRHAA